MAALLQSAVVQYLLVTLHTGNIICNGKWRNSGLKCELKGVSKLALTLFVCKPQMQFILTDQPISRFAVLGQVAFSCLLRPISLQKPSILFIVGSGLKWPDPSKKAGDTRMCHSHSCDVGRGLWILPEQSQHLQCEGLSSWIVTAARKLPDSQQDYPALKLPFCDFSQM